MLNVYKTMSKDKNNVSNEWDRVREHIWVIAQIVWSRLATRKLVSTSVDEYEIKQNREINRLNFETKWFKRTLWLRFELVVNVYKIMSKG